MPNIATVLKDEISRLARREIKAEVDALKKASRQHRSDIAALKRRVAELEKRLGRLGAKAAKSVAQSASGEATGLRFSAKGFQTKRAKLGLSAADMGQLIGVSAQTIYHWETEKARPRRAQMAAIATVRAMGKREAAAKLGR